MRYYAKTYTADPKVGLLTPGEFLTDNQVAALGEDKIAEMAARGILGVTGAKAPKAQEAAKSDEPEEAEVEAEVETEDEADADAEVETEDEADADAEDEAEGEEGGEELLELDAAGEISVDEPTDEQPAKPAKKSGGRQRK